MFATKVHGVDFHSIPNDSNGNPRYVFHWMSLADTYTEACRRAKFIGASKYRGKAFGGGLVIQSYNLEADANRINFYRQKGSEY